MRRYRFLREALEELEDTIAYYERSQPGLGEVFGREVERVLAITARFAEMGAPVEDLPPALNVRRGGRLPGRP